VFELAEASIQPESIGFSPDGRLLAAWTERQVCVIDITAGAARTIWDKGDRYGYCRPGIGFTADSRGVVALHEPEDREFGDHKALQVHDTKTAEANRKFVEVDVWGMDVGANGLVVVAERYDRLVVWNTRTDKRRVAVKWPKGSQVLALSADGNWVAVSNTDQFRLWNIAGTKPPTRARRQFHTDRNKTIWALAVSANGDYVAATSLGLYVWDVQTGKETRIAKAKPGSGREIAFHPSNPLLAFSGGTREVTFWDAPTRSEVKRFAWKIGTVSAVVFSQDGLRCAAAGKGKVVIWDVDA
jgi:WD40 repeat protein